MKKGVLFNSVCLLLLLMSLSFTACQEEKGFYCTWEDVAVSDLDFYNDNIEVVNDSTIGQQVLEYSFFDKTVTSSEALNNVSEKSLGTNICGFEGKFRYMSGSVYEYGFLFNMDQSANTFYMVGITPNGTVVVYEYAAASTETNAAGEVIASTEGYLNNLSGDIGPAVTGIDTKSCNNVIKIESSSNSITVYINGNSVYTINTPKWSKGAVGIFQRIKDTELADYNSSNPLLTRYQFSKIQRR